MLHKRGIKVALWATMNNTKPAVAAVGKPFRADRPDWLIKGTPPQPAHPNG